MDVSGRLPSRLLAASDSLGWRYVRAARYADPAETEPFLTRSDKLLLVLVTSGRYRIESRRGVSWRAASYRPGSVGITAPGNASVLRWRAASSRADGVTAPPPRSRRRGWGSLSRRARAA